MPLEFETYDKLAKEGDAEAQFDLGVSYYTGEGVEQNYEKAVQWFEKAAEQGHADAQFNLGVSYYTGKGVEQNFEEAVKWFKKAAEKGNVEAQINLGVSYYSGRGVEQNFEEAVKWWKKAAEQGHAESQFKLGLFYYNGRGVEQNYEKAVQWYEKAAAQGHAAAQCNLGASYYNGKGVEQNYEKAAQWYEKAAEQGNVVAQCNLAGLYECGEGVEQNYKKAAQWYEKAAEQGHAEAQCNLGVSYYNGKGVEQNYEEAVKWVKKSAEQGHAQAQFNLGMVYVYGKGVEQNFEEAVKWFKKAAEQGHAEAKTLLAKAKKEVSEEGLNPKTNSLSSGNFTKEQLVDILLSDEYSNSMKKQAAEKLDELYPNEFSTEGVEQGVSKVELNPKINSLSSGNFTKEQLVDILLSDKSSDSIKKQAAEKLDELYPNEFSTEKRPNLTGASSGENPPPEVVSDQEKSQINKLAGYYAGLLNSLENDEINNVYFQYSEGKKDSNNKPRERQENESENEYNAYLAGYYSTKNPNVHSEEYTNAYQQGKNGIKLTGPNLMGIAPTGPAPTGPAPTGPAPTGPAPTGPAPTGPAPTGQTPTGQTPTGPAPTGPAPTGQTPTGQTPTGQTPTGPAPTGILEIDKIRNRITQLESQQNNVNINLNNKDVLINSLKQNIVEEINRTNEQKAKNPTVNVQYLNPLTGEIEIMTPDNKIAKLNEDFQKISNNINPLDNNDLISYLSSYGIVFHQGEDINLENLNRELENLRRTHNQDDPNLASQKNELEKELNKIDTDIKFCEYLIRESNSSKSTDFKKEIDKKEKSFISRIEEINRILKLDAVSIKHEAAKISEEISKNVNSILENKDKNDAKQKVEEFIKNATTSEEREIYRKTKNLITKNIEKLQKEKEELESKLRIIKQVNNNNLKSDEERVQKINSIRSNKENVKSSQKELLDKINIKVDNTEKIDRKRKEINDYIKNLGGSRNQTEIDRLKAISDKYDEIYNKLTADNSPLKDLNKEITVQDVLNSLTTEDEQVLNTYNQANEDSDLLKQQLAESIVKNLNQTKNKGKNEKVWLKAVAGAVGLAAGLVLSSVPGVGKIRMGFAAVKITSSVLAKYAESHQGGMIDKAITKIKEFSTDQKEKHPKIAKAIDKIKGTLKNPYVKWGLNGLAIGYMAGNFYEMITKNTIVEGFKNGLSSDASNTTVTASSNIGQTSADDWIKEQGRKAGEVAMKNTSTGRETIDLVSGGNYDLSGLNEIWHDTGLTLKDKIKTVHDLYKDVVVNIVSSPNGGQVAEVVSNSGVVLGRAPIDEVAEVAKAVHR